MDAVVTSEDQAVYHEGEVVTYGVATAVSGAGPTPSERRVSIPAENRTLVARRES